MRAAILSWSGSMLQGPSHSGLCETPKLIEAMMDLGIEVQPIEIDVSESSVDVTGPLERVGFGTLTSATKFFRSADDYDVILNFCGFIPLFWAMTTSTPILTVLDQKAYAKTKNFSDLFASSSEFVWIGSEGEKARSLRGYVIDVASGEQSDAASTIAREIIKIAEQTMERLKREDHRPWGYYVVLSDLEDHKVKRIVVYPKKRLSLQSHKRRSEHWMVISGRGVVTLDSKEIELGPGQAIDIPVGARHRMSNNADQPVVFVEIQTGDYFGEDDIERYEDDFGRL
ncbi:MAG: phosphomannose isomerase type II C-terminal cupin domain [Syntrophaceae bacterium]|mgnify:FL=1|nr:phosphomannose isomerase type II C-terminal cupin domain [Syntrophaceae bacterium]